MEDSCRWRKSHTPTERRMGERSAVARCFPFLEETSERNDFWWTASASADDVNGPNCKFPAGLGVEKLRGEGTTL